MGNKKVYTSIKGQLSSKAVPISQRSHARFFIRHFVLSLNTSQENASYIEPVVFTQSCDLRIANMQLW